MEQVEEPPCSPRRRKPPLDLDAALYIQSQAKNVQEPNSKQSPAGSCSSASKLAGQQFGLGIPYQQQADVNKSNNNINSTSVVTSSAQTFNRYYGNNISVDYIDCVSNTDLTLSPMKAIPSHCKKHLRFHRNRVEPFGVAAPSGAATPDNKPRQQSSSSNNSPLQQSPSGLTFERQLQALTSQEACASKTSDDGSNRLSHRRRLTPNSLVQDDLDNIADAKGGAKLANPCNSEVNETNASPSVLYPISVSEVKKRTYFIGSVGQDSLLGPDELYRYFPNGRVSIFVCTWNQNRKRASMNLNDLLLPDQLVYMADIYAIGIQEAFSSHSDYLRDWEIELQTTLGPNYVLLHSCSLGVLHLSLFVRRDLIWFCSMPEESLYNSRAMPTNMIKTKGAISIAFRFFGTSFMFTNCHFPAHENKLKDRIDEYQRIISSIDLPKNLKLLKPRYLSNDSTARFDCVFFMGDLNFRLEQRTFDETIQILEDIFQRHKDTDHEHLGPSYEALTQNDELLKVMESNQAFHGFDESPIKFPPTYKFLAQTNKYDRQTKRVPSYTDRILFRSKRQRHIQCLIYDWLPQLLSSDHKPVYCLFDVLVRPGHEQNMVTSLNAGLFQRTVYLEALKRRAEDPECIRENGAGGNLICSIS